MVETFTNNQSLGVKILTDDEELNRRCCMWYTSYYLATAATQTNPRQLWQTSHFAE